MKRIVIAGSDILELEITRMSDDNKKRKVLDLYKVADIYIPYASKIRERSKEIVVISKIRTFDSLHIAAAEEANRMCF